MLPRPPIPPLFPYTTLFRSDAVPTLEQVERRIDLDVRREHEDADLGELAPDRPGSLQAFLIDPARVPRDRHRSEEHTSELQSLRHLVCRLLLEKKKNKTTSK